MSATHGPMGCCAHPLLDDDCTWPDCRAWHRNKRAARRKQQPIELTEGDYDRMWRESNRRLLKIGSDPSVPVKRRNLALLGFAKEEEARLQEKLQAMKSGGQNESKRS